MISVCYSVIENYAISIFTVAGLWCNLTFWALAHPGKWNLKISRFLVAHRKSTCVTIFCKILFVVVSHFLMLGVCYTHTEKYEHNNCFLKTKQTFTICKTQNLIKLHNVCDPYI